MATALYSTMYGEIAAHTPGCPIAVIEAYLRKVVTDLCERGKIWRVRATPVTLVAGTWSYPMASPIADTEVSSILQATITSSLTGKVSSIDVATAEQMFALAPGWPTDGLTGEPKYLVTSDPNTVQIQPIPNTAATYTLGMMLAVKPTFTSTGWDATLFTEFRRAIFHGTLHELMMMPNRSWSDDKTAMYHGKQWEYFLYLAKAKANKGFGRAALAVQHRPWA